MFRLQLLDLIAEGDQPFIFGRTTRFLTPMAHALRLDPNPVWSYPARCDRTLSRQHGALADCTDCTRTAASELTP